MTKVKEQPPFQPDEEQQEMMKAAMQVLAKFAADLHQTPENDVYAVRVVVALPNGAYNANFVMGPVGDTKKDDTTIH